MAKKKCSVCQYAFNLALLLDLALNTLLGGDPHESVSARMGRARDFAASKPAAFVCSIITAFSNTVFKSDRDHCTWAQEQQAINADEVWAWSPPDQHL